MPSAALTDLWRALYLTWAASEIAILLITRTPSSSGNVRDRGSLKILWPAIVGSITAGTWFGATHPHTLFHGATWVRVSSLLLFAAGLAIRWTAVATLGRSFSANVAIHATQTVCKSGVFRFIRHPSYTGLLLVIAAIGVHSTHWIGLAITVLPSTAALLYRMRIEEAALLAAFGPEYAMYSKATRRLIPGVY